MKYYTGDINELTEKLNEELTGIKGRRKAKNLAESLIEEMTGLENTFDAYRDSYHHYHIPTNENGGGRSIFVSFTGSKVKGVSKY